MRSVFPYIVAFGIFGQVFLAVIMVWIAQGQLVVEHTRAKEVEAEFEDRLDRGRRRRITGETKAEETPCKKDGLDVMP